VTTEQANKSGNVHYSVAICVLCSSKKFFAVLQL